jgi:hypothetical protein
VKIPLELHEQLLAIATKKTCQAGVEWLAKKGIKVTNEAVRLLVRKHRSERADAAKSIARKYIAETLPKDLEAIDRVQARNLRLLRRAQAEALVEPTVANIEKVCKLTTVVQKADETKKKAVGLEQPDAVFDGLGDVLLALRRSKLD